MAKLLKVDFLLMVAGLVVGAGIGLLFLAGFNRSSLNQFSSLLGLDGRPAVGKPAPGFSLVSLTNEKITLESFAGHPVLINFWATWCTPCRLEMPLLQKYYQRFAPDLVILAVNMQEPETDVHVFANELGLDFTILLDSEASVGELYLVQGLPTTYFIDRKGKISAIHIGMLSQKQLDGYLLKIGVEQ